MGTNGTQAAEAATHDSTEDREDGAPPPPAPFTQDAGASFALVSSSPTISKLFGALARAQSKIEPAKKDTENTHFKSRYADLSAVIEAARPHLAANGLCVMQIPTVSPKGMQVLSTILGHESGEWIESSYPIRPMRQKKDEGWIESYDPQSIGSAFTYARRYAYQGIVGVSAEDDDDGNGASGRDTPKGPQPSEMPCPRCGVVGSIIKGKAEYGGGYLCWQRSTPPGCGEKFREDPRVAMAEAKRAELAAPKDAPADAQKRSELRSALTDPAPKQAPPLPATAHPEAVTGGPAIDAAVDRVLDDAAKQTPVQLARAEAKTMTAHLAELDRVEDVNDAVKALAASTEYKAAGAETKAEIMAEVGRIRTRLGKGR